MRQRLVWVCLALAVRFPCHLYAQLTDPRYYENTPVDVNELDLGYSYAHANTSIDTSLILEGAKFNASRGTIDYTRYFGLFHRLAWVEANLPIAGLAGSVTGTDIHGSVTGTGDSGYQFAMLLKGGPALSVAEFANYKPATTVGVSISVTAPTGLYRPDKILNLGSYRWSFKPEIGLSHPFGPDKKWVFDANANVNFYTDNTAYRGREILRQQALPGLEAHLSYSFTPNLWASFDTRYSFRGDTFVDGVNQNDSQRNLILGSELNVSLSSRNSLVFEFAKSLVHENGPVFGGIAVKCVHVWGKGYK